MKRIIICMDGTWQSLSQDNLTNIGLIARSVSHKETIRNSEGEPVDYIEQIVIYAHGVGANVAALARGGLWAGILRFLNRTLGGAFGEGLEDIIVDTYLRLAFNYEHGDEIYIFGFSRGAFAARRLAGVINSAGIVSRLHVDKAWRAYRLYHDAPGPKASAEKHEEFKQEGLQFRRLYGKGARREDGTRVPRDEPPEITYLGVFDTVIQRGFWGVLQSMSEAGRRHYEFRNLQMCGNVRAARHAMAVDEGRLGFPLTPWVELEEANSRAAERPNARNGYTPFQQLWFVGTHGDVGGGCQSRLSAAALRWVVDGAVQQGLRFYATWGADKSPLTEELEKAGDIYDGDITQPPFWKAILFPLNWKTRRRKIWATRGKNPNPEDVDQYLDATVGQRMIASHVRPPYRPGGLRPFRKAVQEWAKRRGIIS